MNPPAPSPAWLDALRALDTCAVANAIESFGARLRNEGFADGSIRLDGDQATFERFLARLEQFELFFPIIEPVR